MAYRRAIGSALSLILGAGVAADWIVRVVLGLLLALTGLRLGAGV